MVETKKIETIKVVGLHKRKENFQKHYEFVLKVKWIKGPEITVYRPHSMFFDFQGVVAEMFQEKMKITIPPVPVAKFHWLLLGKLGIEKECRAMEDFCQKIANLPSTISQSNIVLHFFDAWGTDIRVGNQFTADNLDLPSIGSPVIQSQESPTESSNAIHTVPPADREHQYRVIADYDATNVGELSLEENSIVTVIEKTERGWWFICNDVGRQGWTPATYLEPLTGEEEGGPDDWILVADPSDRGEIYITILPYSAKNPDEVSYNSQVEVEVLAKSNYGWWRIRYNNEIGLTPATNLQVKDDDYQTPIEIGRKLSISSNSGLYAVIRKAPPRRESVRQSQSRRSTKRPARFVYSATSFSGGKFSFEDDKCRTFPTEVEVVPKTFTQDESVRNASTQQSYENIELRSPITPALSPTNDNRDSISAVDLFPTKGFEKPVKQQQQQKGYINVDMANTIQDHPAKPNPFANLQAKKKNSDNNVPEFFIALANYIPDSDRPEDMMLRKGDVVQLVSVDAGWFFVMSRRPGDDRQGWVPSNYLEKKYDVDIEKLSISGPPNPKPRPRPRPRISDDNGIGPAPHLRAHGKRPSLPTELEDMTPPMTPTSASASDENIYDEPDKGLRSIYDSEEWFFGKISRQECEQLLKTHGRQQEFLIRESTRGSGSYSLSVRYCYRIRHFPIETTADRKLLIGKLKFENLMDIVAHYQEKPLFYSEHKEPITLGKPFENTRM